MGHILHDWHLDQKKLLLNKAYEALPEDGTLIVFETLIDNRQENAFGLLMSLHCWSSYQEALTTEADCCGWDERSRLSRNTSRSLGGPGFDGDRNQITMVRQARG